MTVTQRDESRETDEQGLQQKLSEADPGSRYRTKLGPWIWLVAPLAALMDGLGLDFVYEL
jgi:hypothetical protein